jgi:hypothetical protein
LTQRSLPAAIPQAVKNTTKASNIVLFIFISTAFADVQMDIVEKTGADVKIIFYLLKLINGEEKWREQKFWDGRSSVDKRSPWW